jgi:SAM-dependent methyltransferase
VNEVLRRGDPAEIKALYVELGELLESAVANGGETPILSFPETASVVASMLSETTGLLLDAGCGPYPAASIALSSPGRSVVAVDIALGTVRLARDVARRARVDLSCVVADVEALPFRSGVFDGGVCDDTIEHLPNDRAGVRELARVTSVDGRMVIATPNRHSLETLYRKAVDRLRRRKVPASAYFAAASHLREYTPRQVARLIRPIFRVRRRGTVGWRGGWKKRLATRLTSRAPLRGFDRMIVVEVERRVTRS